MTSLTLQAMQSRVKYKLHLYLFYYRTPEYASRNRERGRYGLNKCSKWGFPKVRMRLHKAMAVVGDDDYDKIGFNSIVTIQERSL